MSPDKKKKLNILSNISISNLNSFPLNVDINGATEKIDRVSNAKVKIAKKKIIKKLNNEWLHVIFKKSKNVFNFSKIFKFKPKIWN